MLKKYRTSPLKLLPKYYRGTILRRSTITLLLDLIALLKEKIRLFSMQKKTAVLITLFCT